MMNVYTCLEIARAHARDADQWDFYNDLLAQLFDGEVSELEAAELAGFLPAADSAIAA